MAVLLSDRRLKAVQPPGSIRLQTLENCCSSAAVSLRSSPMKKSRQLAPSSRFRFTPMKTKAAARALERKARAKKIIARLKREYPDATCALHHKSALEHVAGPLLSAPGPDAPDRMPK